MYKNLFNKLFSFSVGTVITFILSALTTPIITRMVSPEQYGIYSMFILTVSFSSVLLIFGMDHSYARYYLEFENHESEFMKKILKLPMIVTLFYIITFAFLGKIIISVLFNDYSVILLFLIIITSSIAMINRFVMLSIRMSQNGNLYSLTMIIQKSIFVIFTIVLLYFKKNFLVISFGYFISILGSTLFGIIRNKKSWRLINVDDYKVNITMKELILYGSPMIITFLTMWLFQYADRLFISHYYGFKELGIYAAAFSIIALLNVVKDSFVTFWAPVSFERYKKNSNDTDFFKNVNNIVSLIMFLISVFLILFKDIIILLLGEEFREASVIIPFLAFMPIMYTISETTVIGINFKKKSIYHTIISILTLIINLIGNYLLVPIYASVGAAISTGISYIIFFYLRTYISEKLYPIKCDLKKISIVNLLILILALVSTFSSNILLNSIYSIMVLILILLIYRNVIIVIFRSFSNIK